MGEERASQGLEPLEAPDLEPRVVFDVPSMIFVISVALMIAIASSVQFGSLGALLIFMFTAYQGLKIQQALRNRFPPGYWADRMAWARTKPDYYPGRAKKRAPLVRK